MEFKTKNCQKHPSELLLGSYQSNCYSKIEFLCKICLQELSEGSTYEAFDQTFSKIEKAYLDVIEKVKQNPISREEYNDLTVFIFQKEELLSQLTNLLEKRKEKVDIMAKKIIEDFRTNCLLIATEAKTQLEKYVVYCTNLFAIYEKYLNNCFSKQKEADLIPNCKNLKQRILKIEDIKDFEKEFLFITTEGRVYQDLLNTGDICKSLTQQLQQFRDFIVSQCQPKEISQKYLDTLSEYNIIYSNIHKT